MFGGELDRFTGVPVTEPLDSCAGTPIGALLSNSFETRSD